MTDDREYVWIIDLDWQPVVVPGVVECSFPRCKGKAVAILWRARRAASPFNLQTKFAAYYYCPDHLYGRKILDDKVLERVAAGSLAAERGWVSNFGRKPAV